MRISKNVKEAIEAAVAKKRAMTGIDDETSRYEADRNAVVEKVKVIYDEANEKINKILEENDFTPADYIGGKNILALYAYKLDTSRRNEISEMAANVAETYFKKAQNDILDKLRLYGAAVELNDLIDEFMNEPVDFVADAERIVTEKERKLKEKREAEEARRIEAAIKRAAEVENIIQEEFNLSEEETVDQAVEMTA